MSEELKEALGNLKDEVIGMKETYEELFSRDREVGKAFGVFEDLVQKRIDTQVNEKIAKGGTP